MLLTDSCRPRPRTPSLGHKRDSANPQTERVQPRFFIPAKKPTGPRLPGLFRSCNTMCTARVDDKPHVLDDFGRVQSGVAHRYNLVFTSIVGTSLEPRNISARLFKARCLSVLIYQYRDDLVLIPLAIVLAAISGFFGFFCWRRWRFFSLYQEGESGPAERGL
jgi:hypothetical protein